MHQYATLEDTVYFGFAANLITGAAGDGASPTFQVRLAGAAAGAAPVLTGTPTLLSSASFVDGSYEVAVAATAANGFAADGVYLVFAGLTISSVIPNACIGTFKLSAVPANLTSILGTALTETAGQIAAAFKQFFNVASPTGTMKAITLVATCTTNTDMRGTDGAYTGTPPTAAAIADAVLDETAIGHTGALKDVYDNAIQIGAAGAGLTALGDTRIANLDAAISTRSTVTIAQVNAEAVDAIATDTYAEPGQGAPAATTSLAAKINYLYKWARNKVTNDGTDTKHYADDGTTVDQKRTTSESGGTVTKGEMITGA